MDAGTLHTNASSNWVDALVVRLIGHFGTLTRDTFDIFDGDESVENLGNLKLKQTLKEQRACTRQDYQRCRIAHLNTNNLSLYISRALSPAKVSQIKINEETKKADVYLEPDQVSLAIGKGGTNIKLASQLTGYEIDVYRESVDEEDVDLEEFADEIDGWVLDALKAIGCDTAKSVLEIPAAELVHRTDLEENTINDVLKILKAEFE